MRKLIGTLLGFSIALAADGQNVIVVDSWPANTPSDATIYLASNENGWNPGDSAFVFTETQATLVLTLPQSFPSNFQGKLTRGNWLSVEGNEGGGNIPNRSFNFTNFDTLHITVLSWEDLGGTPSDLPPNVVSLSTDFYMPQLDRGRRVRLFLPSDYNNTTIHYPVLYMHDGQNLFSASESFAGEWEVDESLLNFEANGYAGAIIVAIDNGGSFRIEEYTPWANSQYGGGEGEAYMEFIVNTLKPHVDSTYRTLTNRENTGVMGSSLGGLISHYGAMAYQNVFSKVGVFSPSFWFTDDIYDFTASAGHLAETKFYFLAGGQESESLQQEVLAMMDTMTANGFSESELEFKFVANGQHGEWFWAQEFPDAFEWLYMSNPTNTGKRVLKSEIQIFPNPVHDTLNFTLPNRDEDANITIFDSAGRLILSLSQKRNSVDLSKLKKGTYLVKIVTQQSNSSFNIVKL